MTDYANIAQANALIMQKQILQSTLDMLSQTGSFIPSFIVCNESVDAMGGQVSATMPSPTPQAVVDAVSAWINSRMAAIDLDLTNLGVTNPPA